MKAMKHTPNDRNLDPDKASDIQPLTVWRFLPAFCQPFIILARLDRPIGWWLLVLPGWWVLAGYSPSLRQMIAGMLIFLIGAIVMRAAGCVINDFWDRDIDKHIARTRQRPLAAGQITLFQAGIFLGLLVLIGLFLLKQLPLQSWLVGLAAAPLIILYPLAKRVFGFPQLILGLTFSWAIPVSAVIIWGYALPDGVYLLYIGTVFWVIGYDTIYAVQDMEDDRQTGVKSSALSLGRFVKLGVTAAYSAAVLFWGLGFYSLSGWDLWLMGLAGAAIHLVWQLARLRLENPHIALRLFKSNRDVGLFLTCGLMAQNLL